jgi:BON domain-containing protein
MGRQQTRGGGETGFEDRSEHRWRGGLLGWIGAGIRAAASWLGDRMAGAGTRIGGRLSGESAQLGSALRGRGEQVGAALERRTERGPVWPRSYQRPAERILDDVYRNVAMSGAEVEAVEIEVSDGIVTLSGTVPSRFAKRAVEDVAEDVFGVREVHNHLQVAPPAEGAAQAAPQPEAEQREAGEQARPGGTGPGPSGEARPQA